MAVVQEEYLLEADERLIDRLERLEKQEKKPGDIRQKVAGILGHPVEQMTRREHKYLADYADRAEEAISNGERTPLLAPLNRT